jgi:hypothetical protein
MPPKRKASSSSPPSILVTSPKTPTTAELAARMLSKYTVTTKMDSSPLLAKSKQIEEAEIPAIEAEETVEESENEVRSPDAADDSCTEEASAKQGTAKKKKEKTTALKRKATPADETEEPAAKKQKAATPKRKATPKTITTARRRRLKKGEQEPEVEPPLPLVIERKRSAVNAFLDTHPPRVRDYETAGSVTSVDELDLLAALIILHVEYQLEYTTLADVSFEDADEMIVDRTETGRVNVDFDKTCDVEKAARAKLADWPTRLEVVNLLELEIDMLVAKRKQLAEDGVRAAGFRVYDDEDIDDGAADLEVVEEDAAEKRDAADEDVADEEDQFGEDIVEEDATEEDGIEVDTIDEDTIEKENPNAVANEEEPEAFGEQGVEDQSEEKSEEK